MPPEPVPRADLTETPARVDVLVAGAGVVGMACARALQRAGVDVAVADPQAPGSGCSEGNAGVIATEHVLPLANAGTLRRLPGMLVDRRGPLYLRASRVPGLLPWLAHFARACTPARSAAATRALAALTGASLDAWREELSACGACDLLALRGLYSVYRSERALQRDAAERRLAGHFGIPWEILDGAELRRREPALAPALRHAVYYPGVAHVLDPGAVVTRLAAAFVSAGGRVVQHAVSGFTASAHELAVELGAARLRCRYLVVATGIDSATLCRQAGLRVPLVAELGYHLAWPEAVPRLGAPVADAEQAFIVTPMSGQLRAAGTVEFARRPGAPSWRRAERLRPLTADLLAAPLPGRPTRWRGARPTLPDYLPAIGPLPGCPRVLAAFGHQHVGLTTAAVTGVLVRDLVLERTPPIDPAPYRPGRFARAPATRRDSVRDVR